MHRIKTWEIISNPSYLDFCMVCVQSKHIILYIHYIYIYISIYQVYNYVLHRPPHPVWLWLLSWQVNSFRHPGRVKLWSRPNLFLTVVWRNPLSPTTNAVTSAAVKADRLAKQRLKPKCERWVKVLSFSFSGDTQLKNPKQKWLPSVKERERERESKRQRERERKKKKEKRKNKRENKTQKAKTDCFY